MNATELWSSKSSSSGYGTQSSSTCTPQRERHSETGTASQTQTMKYKDAAKAEAATVSMRWLMRWSETPKCRRASSSTAKSDPGPLANLPLASAHTGASTGTGNAHPAWSSRQCFPTVPRCVGYWRPGDPAVCRYPQLPGRLQQCPREISPRPATRFTQAAKQLRSPTGSDVDHAD